MNLENLKLENQICFPLYATSRLVIQQYQPLLNELAITYPQYLVLLVLWEQDGVPVKKLTELLHLETNTLTPLLKRLEVKGILKRERDKQDERKVLVSLTPEGYKLKEKAQQIPEKLKENLSCLAINKEELKTLKSILDRFLVGMKEMK